MGMAAKFSLGLASLLCTTFAVAQSNVGELLDAGAKVISAERFREEVVQRVLVGPTASGGSMELIYATTGRIEGKGTLEVSPTYLLGSYFPVSGDWTIDDKGRVCTTMRVRYHYGDVALPPRCQVWFKYGDQYFIADSDTDRRAKVLSRTVKP
jgi:hypothetical protein